MSVSNHSAPFLVSFALSSSSLSSSSASAALASATMPEVFNQSKKKWDSLKATLTDKALRLFEAEYNPRIDEIRTIFQQMTVNGYSSEKIKERIEGLCVNLDTAMQKFADTTSEYKKRSGEVKKSLESISQRIRITNIDFDSLPSSLSAAAASSSSSTSSSSTTSDQAKAKCSASKLKEGVCTKAKVSPNSDNNVTVPEGMSRSDALKALWKCSSPASFFSTIPDGDQVRQAQETAAWKDKEQVEADLQRNPYIDYFGGRCIKVNMSSFPKLNISSYKKSCNPNMTTEEIENRCLRNEAVKVAVEEYGERLKIHE